MAEALYDIAEPGASKAKEKCAGRAIGIDLGTTNSLVSLRYYARFMDEVEGKE